jgi:hypothetical protein
MKASGELIFSARVSLDFRSLVFSNVIIMDSVFGPENLKSDRKDSIFASVIQIVLGQQFFYVIFLIELHGKGFFP